jgi:hypothetical protein
MMLFEFIIKILKNKNDLRNYHPYYISQLEHELFIDKPLALSKAKYIILPKNTDEYVKRVFEYKINKSYPYIKIIYNDYSSWLIISQ